MNLEGPVACFPPLPSALALTLPPCSILVPRVKMQGAPPLQGWRERGRRAYEELVSGGREPALELQLLFGNTNCSRFVISGEKLRLVISVFFAL